MSLGLPTKTLPSLPKRGTLTCIVGPPGSGKSSLAAQFPSPEAVIDPRDEGLIDLIYEGLVPIKLEDVHKSTSFGSYKANLQACEHSPSKTVICEGIIGVQALCHDEACRKDYEGDRSGKKFYNYQAGPRTAADVYFQQLLDIMLRLQNLGKHVLFIGHTVVNSEKNLEGEDFMAQLLGADKQMTLRIRATFTNIFVITTIPITIGKTGQVNKVSEYQKWCFPQETPKYPSKNRMGLTQEFKVPNTAKDFYLTLCQQAKRDPSTFFRKAL